MKRMLGAAALFVLAASTAGCGFKIFEDIGSDPHPPTVTITGLSIWEPAPEVTPPAVADRGDGTGRVARDAADRVVSWDSNGFSLTIGQKFVVGRSYTDAGADIVKFHIRDRDGELNLDLTPTGQTYYSGTFGTVVGPAEGIDLTGIAGRHRLELWAEDSHLTRSEKVEFVITLIL